MLSGSAATVGDVAGNYENLAEEAKRITGEMVPVDANPGSERYLSGIRELKSAHHQLYRFVAGAICRWQSSL